MKSRQKKMEETFNASHTGTGVFVPAAVSCPYAPPRGVIGA